LIVRLTTEQIDIIRQAVRQGVGENVSVRLFGSRLNDDARGGDIDLLLQIPHPVDNPALLSARIAARLIRALGGRHVDVVLTAPNLRLLPIHEHALAGTAL
jgi:predicted nucleotidyltransferase